jgi:selenocysteine lyase/cysteine desulfurase
MFFSALDGVPGIHILAPNIRDRIGVFSLCIDGLHHNLGVKILNDRYGIQVRGGCSCAGTYGHYLLNMDRDFSEQMIQKILACEPTEKPGWIRISLHPVMTNQEAAYIIDAVLDLSRNHEEWKNDYVFDVNTNQFTHKNEQAHNPLRNWFSIQ